MGMRNNETQTPSAAAVEAAADACANADDEDEDEDEAASSATASNRNERRPTRIKFRNDRRAAPPPLVPLRCTDCEAEFEMTAFGGNNTDTRAALLLLLAAARCAWRPAERDECTTESAWAAFV
jgi:hypothetical protein